MWESCTGAHGHDQSQSPALSPIRMALGTVLAVAAFVQVQIRCRAMVLAEQVDRTHSHRIRQSFPNTLSRRNRSILAAVQARSRADSENTADWSEAVETLVSECRTAFKEMLTG